MSTAEEIYDKHYKKWQNSSMSLRLATIEAMEAYADQFRSQHVEQEIERLRNDLKRAEEYKPQIEDQAKTERVMVIAAELESEYQQEIERLKDLLLQSESIEQKAALTLKHQTIQKQVKRIAELQAQLKEKDEALSLAIKKVQWFAYNTKPNPEVYCGSQWFTKLSDTKELFKALESTTTGPEAQNQLQPEKVKDEIPQLAQSLEGTYATTGKPDNLNERIYSLSDLGNSAKKLHDAVGKMEKEEQSELINFAVWYSGMEREKVINAYNRYKTETRKHHE